jgi:hypothetical protein
MRRLVNMTNNNNIIRAMERMNDIIDEMKSLYNEFESLVNESEEEKIEDLDSYENIPEDELDELIDEEYKAWAEANFGDEETYDDDEEYDEEDEDEEPIYDIYFTPEQFETILAKFEDLPFGYVYDEQEDEYIVRMDEELADEINEKLEYMRYVAKYEDYYLAEAERILSVQNSIYYGIHYNM